MIACNSLISRMAPWASRFQVKFFEFLRRRAVRAQLVDGHARGGERERRKRLGEQLVEIGARGGAGGDVRIEFLACSLLHERRHIVDHHRVNRGVLVSGGERADRAGCRREWRHGGNDVRLQLEQFGGRLRDNARDAELPGREVVAFVASSFMAFTLASASTLPTAA